MKDSISRAASPTEEATILAVTGMNRQNSHTAERKCRDGPHQNARWAKSSLDGAPSENLYGRCHRHGRPREKGKLFGEGEARDFWNAPEVL
jgi:hypothetical protein